MNNFEARNIRSSIIDCSPSLLFLHMAVMALGTVKPDPLQELHSGLGKRLWLLRSHVVDLIHMGPIASLGAFNGYLNGMLYGILNY